MDNKEFRSAILHNLEMNSRINLEELAISLDTDQAVIANEVAKMEEEKIICGYNALIDWDKTGVDKVSALIEVRVSPQRSQGYDTIAERIYSFPEVKATYLISGRYDLLVNLEEKTLKEVSTFISDKLSSQEEVISTATHFILKKYKYNGIVLESKKD
jgi:DNA-binding Lrp family transcriptional regulator